MKYAVVTGANRGLGLGFVEELIGADYFVFMGIRPGVSASYQHQNAQPLILDIENDQSIIEAVEVLQSQHVVLDLLINNAGVNKRSLSVGGAERVNELVNLDRDALLHMFNVNAVSPVLIARYFLPLLTAQPSFIINISSGRASFDNDSPTGNYGYRASKVALNMFTKASVLDLPDNVQTFAVHPGLVRTDMNPDGDVEPKAAAKNILSIMNAWSPAKNGAYLNFDGEFFPY